MDGLSSVSEYRARLIGLTIKNFREGRGRASKETSPFSPRRTGNDSTYLRSSFSQSRRQSLFTLLDSANGSRL
jgi:hypothetical protein